MKEVCTHPHDVLELDDATVEEYSADKVLKRRAKQDAARRGAAAIVGKWMVRGTI